MGEVARDRRRCEVRSFDIESRKSWDVQAGTYERGRVDVRIALSKEEVDKITRPRNARACFLRPRERSSRSADARRKMQRDPSCFAFLVLEAYDCPDLLHMCDAAAQTRRDNLIFSRRATATPVLRTSV